MVYALVAAISFTESISTPSQRTNGSIGEWVCEERHLDAVDQRGELVRVVDKGGDGRVRERRAETRQERALDLRIGKQVEIDRYAVADLEGERGAAGKIEA